MLSLRSLGHTRRDRRLSGTRPVSLALQVTTLALAVTAEEDSHLQNGMHVELRRSQPAHWSV